MISIEENIKIAEKALQKKELHVAGRAIDNILKENFTHQQAWRMLYQLMNKQEPLEQFQRDFAKKHYPNYVHLLKPEDKNADMRQRRGRDNKGIASNVAKKERKQEDTKPNKKAVPPKKKLHYLLPSQIKDNWLVSHEKETIEIPYSLFGPKLDEVEATVQQFIEDGWIYENRSVAGSIFKKTSLSFMKPDKHFVKHFYPLLFLANGQTENSEKYKLETSGARKDEILMNIFNNEDEKAPSIIYEITGRIQEKDYRLQIKQVESKNEKETILKIKEKNSEKIIGTIVSTTEGWQSELVFAAISGDKKLKIRQAQTRKNLSIDFVIVDQYDSIQGLLSIENESPHGRPTIEIFRSMNPAQYIFDYELLLLAFSCFVARISLSMGVLYSR